MRIQASAIFLLTLLCSSAVAQSPLTTILQEAGQAITAAAPEVVSAVRDALEEQLRRDVEEGLGQNEPDIEGVIINIDDAAPAVELATQESGPVEFAADVGGLRRLLNA